MKELEEHINLWLIELDKSRANVLLSGQLSKQVREFYKQKFKHSLHEVFNNEIFGQLKPQLKKEV